ncbi:MAG: cysteine--tRNA ligase [Gammaproteobacteria bacterium]|nr:cysteine--tRNA ligase [Gammaproteobacteria bacterium]
MSLELHNSLTRRKERFEPGDPTRVTMYVCGPTVYSHPHIGNARPAVVFDVLFRLLSRRYPNVVYARNITDVDDKINKAALERQVDISVVTEEFIDIYHQDMSALGVLAPTVEPRATRHIAQMIAMIERLIQTGHAYAADGHVLFEVGTFAGYGALSGRDRREMIAGARVEVAPYKRDPADFVLWKPSTSDQPGWDSPWGRGRPGWHLECSAMSEEHLGQTIDIHGGGTDLQFPHHENELAQSTCAHDGRLFVRYWLHNGFVNVDSEKMSKSIGNVLLVKDLLEQAPGEAVRLALLSTHYRKPLDWTDTTLSNAQRLLNRLYQALEGGDVESSDTGERAPVPEAVEAALDDDLNTPLAIKCLRDLSQAVAASEGEAERRAAQARLRAAGEALGLLQSSHAAWQQARQGQADDSADVEALIEARAEARKARDFARADGIRDQLLARGIALEDGPAGTTWRRAD